MILLIKLIFITSLWILGLTIITQKGMGLYLIREWAYKQGIWVEPVIRCVWCMASLHSIIGFAFAFGLGILNHFEWNYLLLYVLCVCGSSLLAGVTWTIYETVSQIHLYFKNLNDGS